MRLTDNEIITTLSEMGAESESNFSNAVLDLINRQKAEIERLKELYNLADGTIYEIEDALYRGSDNDWAMDAIDEYKNLVRGMVGE